MGSSVIAKVCQHSRIEAINAMTYAHACEPHTLLTPMPYTVTPTHIPDVLILEPKVFGDSRGFFFESFNQQDFKQVTGLDVQSVQDNYS
jgi:hypothetical protein